MSAGETLQPEQFMYHISSSHNRASIAQHGLRASTPEGVDNDHGVYLSQKPGGALDGQDVWKVRTTKLPVEDDPDDFQSTEFPESGRSYVVSHDIAPGRVRFHSHGEQPEEEE